MKNLLIALVLIVTVISGCKKDDPVPERDKFLGHWTGTVIQVITANGDFLQSNTFVGTEDITNGSLNDQILINANTSNFLNADIIGSIYTVSEQNSFAPVSDGSKIAVVVSGSGSLSDGNTVLKSSYTMKGKYNNINLVWHISKTLNKD
ncbi:MAG: hypothetical protein Q8R96_11600 [Bacteroidota bacterium]|nr:hypothetical protein [Bacteroidota bacterium]